MLKLCLCSEPLCNMYRKLQLCCYSQASYLPVFKSFSKTVLTCVFMEDSVTLSKKLIEKMCF